MFTPCTPRYESGAVSDQDLVAMTISPAFRRVRLDLLEQVLPHGFDTRPSKGDPHGRSRARVIGCPDVPEFDYHYAIMSKYWRRATAACLAAAFRSEERRVGRDGGSE